MSKCDTCGRKAYGYLCDGCIHDPENKDLYEPMTNADRIRAMSDEDLAEFIVSHSFAVIGCSRTAWLEYLKQPVKEEER